MRDVNWRVAMAADMSGDGKADILWRHLVTSGETAVWLMDGGNRVGRGALEGQTTEVEWGVAFHPSPAPASTLFVATLAARRRGGHARPRERRRCSWPPDERSAKLTLSFAGLTTDQIAAHIHGPADPGGTALARLQPAAGHLLRAVVDVRAHRAASAWTDQLTALRTGRLYVNVHTSTYPSGEIRGHYRAGARPVAGGAAAQPGAGHADHAGGGAAVPGAGQHGADAGARGPRARPRLRRLHRRAVRAAALDVPGLRERGRRPRTTPPAWARSASRFYMNALNGPDQLRQRVAFALSQILVVSSRDIFDGPAMAVYVDILTNHAFGNFRQLLEEITLNPAMGNYLDMVNNDKPNPATGRTANENYARELLQLFSIGVFKLNPNGTLKLDHGRGRAARAHPSRPTSSARSKASPASSRAGPTTPSRPARRPRTSTTRQYYLEPMVLIPSRHDMNAKEVLDGVVLPAGRTGHAGSGRRAGPGLQPPQRGALHRPAAHPAPGDEQSQPGLRGPRDASLRGLPPHGGGMRGDLRAVVKAVLLDVEARRDPTTLADFGRLQDPAVFVTRTLRSLEGTGQGYGLQERVSPMGQSVYSPPTVFSFYSPDYQVPGTPLLGPPFQIFTESTAIRRANFINTIVFGSISLPSYAPAGSTTASVEPDALDQPGRPTRRRWWTTCRCA